MPGIYLLNDWVGGYEEGGGRDTRHLLKNKSESTSINDCFAMISARCLSHRGLELQFDLVILDDLSIETREWV
jgi:hypothetical protein